MGFHVWSLSLNFAIASSVREIVNKIFAGPAPTFLHHYTSAATVKSIIESRSMWATCIADQRDTAEISHASQLVASTAAEIARSGTSEFAGDVLKRLPYFMEERKQWIYIACFCDDDSSALHWKEYGPYRLSFTTPWSDRPALGLLDSRSECWYQRVIYDETVQRDALKGGLQAIVVAITQNTRGRNEGPWAHAMVDGCAREAAQLLLGLAVGFKRRSFGGEREWRIVCAPRLGSNNSSPEWIDDNFKGNIKQSPRRHVVLNVPRRQNLFEPLLIPPVPFLGYRCNPDRDCPEETQSINGALAANHRPDLVHS